MELNNIFSLVKQKKARLMCVLSHVWIFVTVAHQAPLPMGFPRQEFRSGLPFPTPGDLPNQGLEPASPTLAGRFFTTDPPGKPSMAYM